MDGLYVVKYPSDFRKANFTSSRTAMNNQPSLLFSSVITLDDPFVLSSRVLFDLHIANFNVNLLKMTKEQFESTEEDAANDDDKKASTHFEVVSRQTSISNV